MRFFTLLIVFLLLDVVKINAQGSYCPPPNIGFETGTFGNWVCDTGRIDMAGNINVVPSAPVYGWQTMIDKNYYPQLDPYGNFPTLCPYGGTHSIVIGNIDTNRKAERISYTFTVPAGANQYALIFYYAVVLQNPHHLDYQQPRFTVKTYDLTDNTYIACSSFDFIASGSLPGFKLSSAPTLNPKDTVYYKDWAPATINLDGYAGKQVQLEFTANDCTLGGHFGYAYLDVDEDCGPPITGNAYCTNQNSVTLTAPGGFGDYLWYTPDLSKQLFEGQVYTISPPPADGTQYAVITYPFNGLGCADTLYTTVNKNNSDFNFKVTDTLYACAGGAVDLTASTVTAGSSSTLQLSYSTDADGLYYLYQPQSITMSGTYYIKAVSPQGCNNILPVNVIIGNPVVKVTNPPPVNYPATVDISTTFAHAPNTTYTYFTDSEATLMVDDYQHIGHSGTYYIKATSKTGCVTIKPVTVVVNPPPPPITQAVNTFTPNNDGINDYFSVTIVGYGEFGSLRIYSRYGQLVFQTKSSDTPWDGKYNGRPAPVGTYYWLFDGINTYDHSKVVASGFIALIR